MQYIVDGLLYDTDVMDKVVTYMDWILLVDMEPYRVAKTLYKTKSGRWFETVNYSEYNNPEGFSVNEEYVKHILLSYPKLYAKYFDVEEA